MVLEVEISRSQNSFHLKKFELISELLIFKTLSLVGVVITRLDNEVLVWTNIIVLSLD